MGVVLYQFSIDAKVDDVGLILVGKNLAQKRSADFFLHVEHSQLAAGGIDEDAERQRQVRFGGEIFNGLRLAVFEDRKVVLGKVGNERAVLVFDVEEESDHVNTDFEGFLRRLVRGSLGVGGLLGWGRLSGRGLWDSGNVARCKWSGSRQGCQKDYYGRTGHDREEPLVCG